MKTPIIEEIYARADDLHFRCDGIYDEYKDDDTVSDDEKQLLSVIEKQAEALFLSIDLLKCGFKK